MTVITRAGDVLDFIQDDMFRLIAAAHEAGFATEEVIQGIEQMAILMRNALEEDPEPADDPV